MTSSESEFQATLRTERIKQFCQEALRYFLISEANNIFENDRDELKIVRLYDKEDKPIFFLVSQKLGAGAFGEVSHGAQLDIESGTVIPDTDVAVKITDYTQGGALAKRDLEAARQETVHEYNILSNVSSIFKKSITY